MSILNIPQKKIDNLIRYADDVNQWVNTDIIIQDIEKHTIRHYGFEIIYSVTFKTDDEDNTVSNLPNRCLAFRYDHKAYKDDDIKDFIKRTIMLFNFTDPHLTEGTKGNVHYYEKMFGI